jgi:Flp pilus assembly protein TadD
VVPRAATGFVSLAGAALAGGEPHRAAVHLEQGLVQMPNEPELTVRLAEAYLRQRRFRKAIGVATRVSNVDAVHSDCLDVLGRAHLARGDHVRAMELANTLVATAPDDPRGLALRGRASLAAGNAGAAASDLRRYVRGRPGDAEGYRDLARCLAALGEEDAARAQERLAAYVAGAR